MIKYVPDMLSVLRIILAALLVPLMNFHAAFIIVYIVIGITDLLDGLIARKFGYESEFGAKLDSAADFVFFSIFVYLFLKLYSSIIDVTYLAGLTAIIFVRMINILLTKLKYRKVIFIHTFANKASGIIIYLLPITLLLVSDGLVLWITLVMAFIAAVEELFITVKYSEPFLNRKSIFFK